MLYHIQCVDKPGSADIRTANRSAHLAFLEQHADALFAAGPTLADDGNGMTGSVIIIDLPDQAAVDRFCAEDPYAKAGLFQSVTVRPWRRVYPKA
jgi:uncharacterized protein YciI